MIGKLKEYFCYEDKLRKIVSIVTGYLIILYSVLSGVILSYLIFNHFLGSLNIYIKIFIIVFVIGLPAGFLILYTEIKTLNLFIGENQIEKYTYLRVLLFVSIIFYLTFLVIFYLTGIVETLFS